MMNRIQQIAHDKYGTNVLTCDSDMVGLILNDYASEEGIGVAERAQQKINAMRAPRNQPGYYGIIQEGN